MKIWMLWSTVLGLVLASAVVMGESPDTGGADFYLRLVGGPVVETAPCPVAEPLFGLYAVLPNQGQTRRRQRSDGAGSGPDKDRRQQPPPHQLSLGGYGQYRQSQTYGQIGR
jgi:hypothetical protein